MRQTIAAAHLAWLHEPRIMPLCVAHRGASDYGFDNSEEAFERAALLGADLFEVDVRTTADGVLVAWHDPTVRQLGGEPYPVSSLSLQQLHDMAAAAGRSILLFDDVLALARDHDIGIYTDAKDSNAAQQSGRHLSTFGIKRGVIASYNTTCIRALRDQGIKHALSVLVPATGDPMALAELSGADIVHLCWVNAKSEVQARLSEALLARLHDAGLAVVLWHQEDPTIVDAWLDLPVLGICSNQPELLFSFHRYLQNWKPSIMCTGGIRHIAPQNTWAALSCAFNAGYDYVRLTVRLSSDGTAVVSSDVAISRLLQAESKIADLPLRKLQQIDAGSAFDPWFAGVSIMTLVEALALAQQRQRGLAIEVTAESLASVVKRVKEDSCLTPHMFWSHDPDCLRKLSETNSEVKVLTRRDSHTSLTDALAIKGVQCVQFDAERDDLTEVSICQSLGCLALVTCDNGETATLRRAIKVRPDIIENDSLWQLKALL